jgi:hypothetical protein
LPEQKWDRSVATAVCTCVEVRDLRQFDCAPGLQRPFSSLLQKYRKTAPSFRRDDHSLRRHRFGRGLYQVFITAAAHGEKMDATFARLRRRQAPGDRFCPHCGLAPAKD